MPSSSSPSLVAGATLENHKGLEIKFTDMYSLKQRLRSGSFGVVYSASMLQSHEEVAVKVIDRSKLKQSDDEAVFREVSVMKELVDVPQVVHMIDFFVEKSKFYVVLAYYKGGDVFDRLSKRTHYTEKDARDLAGILLHAVFAMHARRIVHRDIKPENMLLVNPDEDSNIVLADFGFARHMPSKAEDGEDYPLQTRCGTPAFVAPEVVIGTKYNEQADMWSVGVVLYMLLAGYPPFQSNNHRELFRKIRASDYVFHDQYWKNMSVEVKQLIAGLLVVNPQDRLTAEQALHSDWMTRCSEDDLRNKALDGALSEIRKFRAMRALKSAVWGIRWAISAPFWNPDAVTFSQQMAVWDHEHQKATLADSDGNPAGTVANKVTFDDRYTIRTQLRKGAFATVWECVHKQTQEVFAVKIIKRNGLKPVDDEAVMNEVAVMQSLSDCKYVVQLVDFYEQEDCFYLVMEFMSGGDVFDRIVDKTHYTEKDARDLMKILLKGLEYMHEQGIAHRDIKPQNLLLQSKKDDAAIKIADFGFSKRVHMSQSLTSRCGTPSYVAPEILKNIPHDQSVDMWSAGVVLYVLLVGYPPFVDENQAAMFGKIRTGDWQFYEEDWKNVSKEARDLIEGLLVGEPKHRWTAQEALRCEWIMEDDQLLRSRDLSQSLQQIRDRRARLRGLAKAVIWMNNKHDSAEPVLAATKSNDMQVDEEDGWKVGSSHRDIC